MIIFAGPNIYLCVKNAIFIGTTYLTQKRIVLDYFFNNDYIYYEYMIIIAFHEYLEKRINLTLATCMDGFSITKANLVYHLSNKVDPLKPNQPMVFLYSTISFLLFYIYIIHELYILFNI